jgi:hypothetical protein
MKTLTNLIMTIMIITSVINISEAKVNFTKKIGGTSGTSFTLPSERAEILSTENITRIAIRHGRRIEQIQIEYSNRQGFNQVEFIGNDAGKWSVIELEEGEFITYITGRAGTLIDQLTFHTSMRRTFGPYGGSGGQEFEISIPSDAKVIGFTGKAGPSINQIGLIYWRPNKAPDISRNRYRGTRYEGTKGGDVSKKSSRVVRDHRTGKNNDEMDSGNDVRYSKKEKPEESGKSFIEELKDILRKKAGRDINKEEVVDPPKPDNTSEEKKDLN